MTSTYYFAPTTVAQSSNQCYTTRNLVLSLLCNVDAGREIISVVSSWVSDMYNSFQLLHNSDSGENLFSVCLTNIACEEINMDRENNLLRLDQISELEDDWNGYGAKHFSPELIKKCKDIINALNFQPKVFPTGRQSLQFQYELEDRSYLEFEIFQGKISCLQVPQRRYLDAQTCEFSTSEIEKIKEIVKKFYERDSGAK